MLFASVVMPGLVPGIHVFLWVRKKDVDGRDKPGHDGSVISYPPYHGCGHLNHGPDAGG
jgi:hypothetical protein